MRYCREPRDIRAPICLREKMQKQAWLMMDRSRPFWGVSRVRRGRGIHRCNLFDRLDVLERSQMLVPVEYLRYCGAAVGHALVYD